MMSMICLGYEMTENSRRPSDIDIFFVLSTPLILEKVRGALSVYCARIRIA